MLYPLSYGGDVPAYGGIPEADKESPGRSYIVPARELHPGVPLARPLNVAVAPPPGAPSKRLWPPPSAPNTPDTLSWRKCFLFSNL